MSAVLILDVGKPDVKLSAAGLDGRLVETLSTPNPVRPGPPYPHHDLEWVEDWLLSGMRALGGRHAIEAVVACGHGSGGVLAGEGGAVRPQVDHEQPAPPGLDVADRAAVGPFRERGSGAMLGLTHLARQMLFLQRGWPDAFARAQAFLALPQDWAWRLSGVMPSEVTSFVAQFHLWCVRDGRPAAVVGEPGWERLLPPLRPARAALGPLRPEVATRTGRPTAARVLDGIHDSSADVYRCQAAGLADLIVPSTGTWIVALSDGPGPSFDEERPALCCNAEVCSRPLTGVLAMGGRAFTAVAEDAPGPAILAALRPKRRVLVDRDGAGATAGAALLLDHEARTAPVRLDLDRRDPIDHPALRACPAAWRARACQAVADTRGLKNGSLLAGSVADIGRHG